ncbi:hypothetical protein PTKIN_Ptkin19aG0044900 [Pterospermum kingtungense]
MATSRNHPIELKIAVSVLLIFYLIAFSPSKSVSATDNESSKGVKMVPGSRPPKCINRCFSCRPCMAALVASPNHRNGPSSSYKAGDESYYLLAWKCKCGDKFFQP